jgi:hypothetical protein
MMSEWTTEGLRDVAMAPSSIDPGNYRNVHSLATASRCNDHSRQEHVQTGKSQGPALSVARPGSMQEYLRAAMHQAQASVVRLP